MLGIAFYAAGTGYYFPFRHEHDSTHFGDINLPIEWLADLEPLFSDESKTWIFHNFPFDGNIMEKEGLVIKGRIHDILPRAHLVNENLYSYKLDALGLHYLNERKVDIRKLLLPHYGRWEAIPPLAMGKYAVQDTKLTHDLDFVIGPLLEKEELTQLWDNEDEAYCRTLAKVIDAGILIDRSFANSLEQQANNRLQEIQHTLGFDPGKPGILAHNLHGRPEENGLGLPVLQGYGKRKSKEFPQGLPNMDVVALSMVRLENIPDQAKQVIDLVLEYRSTQKAASTYYGPIQRKASLRTNLVHPDLKQHGTKTGRLSGDMQQIPRDVEKYPVKKIFKSPIDWELWEFDYNQIELRFAVVYSRCELLGRAFFDGTDIHKQTAELIGAYALLNDPFKARQIGKTSNYLLGYGGGPEKLQYTIFKDTGIVTSIGDCTTWHRGFNEGMPEFKLKSYEVQRIAEQRGYIKLWNGRRCRFPYTRDCWLAWNRLIQGGAGQVVKHTMNRLNAAEWFVGKMVLQVHDSLWIYLPSEHVETQKKLIIDLMEWPTADLEFPFPVDAKRLDNDNRLETVSS